MNRIGNRDRSARMMAISVLMILCILSVGVADVFTYKDEDGKTVELEARLVGSGLDRHILEKNDGERVMILQAALQKRVPKEGPAPLGTDAVLKQLAAKFGEEKFRAEVSDPFIVGVVLTEALPEDSERRVGALLKKSAQYMHQIQDVFTGFAKRAGIPVVDPAYPLVVLIFETDDDFNKFAESATPGDGKGKGLSAAATAGFYSALSNRLYIRMSECYDFATPLHEAIHQQCFNRGVLNRMALLPVWFVEGMATGFEGDGEKIKVEPTQINPRYARNVLTTAGLSWNDIFQFDSAFRGDVLAGAAYSQGWGLHWYLFTQHNKGYSEYLRTLSQIEPLQFYAKEEREKDFQAAFKGSVEGFQGRFQQILPGAVRSNRVKFEKPLPPGYIIRDLTLARVTLFGQIRAGGRVYVRGTIRNISPIRPMTFYVTVQTDSGMYTDWLISNLGIKRRIKLDQKFVNKRMEGGPGGPSQSFQVHVQAATTESAEAIAWKSGKRPIPVFGQPKPADTSSDEPEN